MTRLSFVALLALASSGFVIATPTAMQEVVVAGDARTTNSWSYTDCEIPTDAVIINSLTVSPDPPKPGQDITVTVNATASKTIEEGAYATATIKLGLITILRKTFDICEEARNANATVQCPVQEGNYVIKHTASLPKEIPLARFNIDIMGYTADDDDMFCLRVVANFLPNFSPL